MNEETRAKVESALGRIMELVRAEVPPRTDLRNVERNVRSALIGVAEVAATDNVLRDEYKRQAILEAEGKVQSAIWDAERTVSVAQAELTAVQEKAESDRRVAEAVRLIGRALRGIDRDEVEG